MVLPRNSDMPKLSQEELAKEMTATKLAYELKQAEALSLRGRLGALQRDWNSRFDDDGQLDIEDAIEQQSVAAQ